jgi:hypothetical protein
LPCKFLYVPKFMDENEECPLDENTCLGFPAWS